MSFSVLLLTNNRKGSSSVYIQSLLPDAAGGQVGSEQSQSSVSIVLKLGDLLVAAGP